MKNSIVLVLLLTLLITACAKRPSPDNFYFGAYSEAEALFNRGEYEKALQKYQAYIDENPEGNLAIISQYYMGRSYSALGRKDDAKAIFEKIRQKYPDVVWANFSETQLKELDKV